MREPNHDLDDAERLRDEIYTIATSAGGVITGEHGIGKARIQKLRGVLAVKELELMAKIKKGFDPNDILNPGTKIPNDISSS
jgi:FAD/FMN-containing dehydrogenase